MYFYFLFPEPMGSTWHLCVCVMFSLAQAGLKLAVQLKMALNCDPPASALECWVWTTTSIFGFCVMWYWGCTVALCSPGGATPQLPHSGSSWISSAFTHRLSMNESILLTS